MTYDSNPEVFILRVIDLKGIPRMAAVDSPELARKLLRDYGLDQCEYSLSVCLFNCGPVREGADAFGDPPRGTGGGWA